MSTTLQRVLWKILGSVVAVIVGMSAGAVSMQLTGWGRSDVWRAFPGQFLMISIFAAPVWLIVLLPLYLFLPRSSVLWRPMVCTALGAISGGLLILVTFKISAWPDPAMDIVTMFAPFGIIVGAVTCLVGSLTASYFHSAPES